MDLLVGILGSLGEAFLRGFLWVGVGVCNSDGLANCLSMALEKHGDLSCCRWWVGGIIAGSSWTAIFFPVAVTS